MRTTIEMSQTDIERAIRLLDDNLRRYANLIEAVERKHSWTASEKTMTISNYQMYIAIAKMLRDQLGAALTQMLETPTENRT